MDFKNNIILINSIKKSSDYLKKDIVNTLKYYNIKINKNNKKDILFNELIKYISAVKIQNKIRYILYKKIVKCRGKGYLTNNSSNDNIDFYTLDIIPNIYYISYEDDSMVWSFDIRSLNKLISNNFVNPYTTKQFPKNLLSNLNILNNYLNSNKIIINHIEINDNNRYDNIVNNINDLLCDMSIYGYHFEADWFLTLNTNKLKKLYYLLEDIWNYRANLSNNIKIEYCPPNGKIFNIPHRDIELISSKVELQEILVNDFNKFKNTPISSNKTILYIYILLGIGHFQKICFDSNPILYHTLQ